MKPEPRRLRLGPVVGHTDTTSVRIWIRTLDDPGQYTLDIRRVGSFAFVSTETQFEFGTAIAVATGLRSNHHYQYTIRRLGRTLPGASGSFRTMPPPHLFDELQFAVISCSDQVELGGWEKLRKFIDDTRPRFLLLIGDQVYNDQSTAAGLPDVWASHLESPRDLRRQAMAEKYQENWSRPAVREVLANIPSYMIWDDHEVRDGWGSFAPDSPTLGARFPKGRKIHEKYYAFFADARDVAWHFQMVHNPPPALALSQSLPEGATEPLPPPYLESSKAPTQALPFVFRAGRTAIVVVDGRGDRDLWREELPILGAGQWEFLTEVVEGMPADIDALVFVTPVPIVSMAPNGMTQHTVGHRTDDVGYLEEGNEECLRAMMATEGSDFPSVVGGFAMLNLSAIGIHANLGAFQLTNVDDVRDQWAHSTSRPEQESLIRLAVQARTQNRTRGSARGLLFIGGDLHSGALFDIDVSDPECAFQCLIASSIGRTSSVKFPGLLGTLFDSEFDVADGIHAKLKYAINEYNFGAVNVVCDTRTAHISASLVFSGKSTTAGVRLKIERPKQPFGPGYPSKP